MQAARAAEVDVVDALWVLASLQKGSLLPMEEARGVRRQREEEPEVENRRVRRNGMEDEADDEGDEGSFEVEEKDMPANLKLGTADAWATERMNAYAGQPFVRIPGEPMLVCMSCRESVSLLNDRIDGHIKTKKHQRTMLGFRMPDPLPAIRVMEKKQKRK